MLLAQASVALAASVMGAALSLLESKSSSMSYIRIWITLAGHTVAGAGASFVPNAAIINYYGLGDTLNGHIDDVERNMTQPIVALSLGCDAVFLMGGTPLAMEAAHMKHSVTRASCAA